MIPSNTRILELAILIKKIVYVISKTFRNLWTFWTCEILTLIHKQFVKLQTLFNYETLNNVIYILMSEISIESPITFSNNIIPWQTKKKKNLSFTSLHTISDSPSIDIRSKILIYLSNKWFWKNKFSHQKMVIFHIKALIK